MSLENQLKTRTEAVGVFDAAAALQEAIDELLISGFNQAEVSLLSSETAVEEKLGHAYKKVTELEDNLSVPRAAYVSIESIGDAEGAAIGGLVYIAAVSAAGAVVASGGTLAAVISAVALASGIGGLFGTSLAQLIEDRHARYLAEQVDHGGLLLWVRTRDKEHERLAVEILSKHSAHDVHLHDLTDISSQIDRQ